MAEGWKKVGLGLVFSTFLGFLGGLLVITVIFWLFRKAVPGKVRGLFRWLQVFSSAFMAFSHGSNDGQKFMGAFTLALVLGGVLPTFDIPLWVILVCAVVMAIGTITGGWRIIRTMGIRITKLETHQGFAAEMPPRAPSRWPRSWASRSRPRTRSPWRSWASARRAASPPCAGA